MNRLDNKVFFITGTDTDAGKTLFAAALLRALDKAGLATRAFKPVAAGCELIDGEWKNEDALVLLAESNQQQSYQQVNPVALQRAIAPHIAAEEEKVLLSTDLLVGRLSDCSDFEGATVIEGAGGWRVPLNNREDMSDFVVALSQKQPLAVIMVVSMKLGCINHALLTEQSIRQSGLPLAGWVANSVSTPMSAYQQNLETLKARLDCPLIAEIPLLESGDVIEQAAKCVKLQHLI